MLKNTVTQNEINALLDLAPRQEVVFWEKELLVSYLLPNGFTVTGRSATVDKRNFNIEYGRELCRKDAENQLWALLGYQLQDKLYKEGVL